MGRVAALARMAFIVSNAACLAAPGGSGDGGSDGGGEDAAPVDAEPGAADARPCIPRDAFPSFEDAFNDDALSWTDGIYVEPTGTPIVAEVAAGVLTVELVDMAGHMLLLKTRVVDLRDVRLTLELLEVPNPAVDGARAWFSVLPFGNADDSIDVMYLEDRLQTPTDEIDYDPEADRWWQMRVTGSAILIETAPDGMGWKQIDTIPLPPGMEAAAFEVGTKTDFDMAGAGRLVIDRLNLPPDRCP